MTKLITTDNNYKWIVEVLFSNIQFNKTMDQYVFVEKEKKTFNRNISQKGMEEKTFFDINEN